MTLSNPDSPMRHHKTSTQGVHVPPSPEHYKANSKPYVPLE